MNQNFSPSQLIKFCKKDEFDKYQIKKSDLLNNLNKVSKSILDGDFEFDIRNVGGNYVISDISELLVLRKLNDNLKKIYKDVQANRRVIVSQMKVLLAENSPMWILKTDINSFYESVNRQRLIEKFKNDTLLSFHSLRVLDKILSHPILANHTGLPRGISISSTLSEIYMRKFDRWVKRFDGVYYYARFVDDIVIFAGSKRVLEDIDKQINENLEKGLTKNESKTSIFNGNDLVGPNSLEYLGYRFSTSFHRKTKTLKVSIAQKKIQKIKSRLIISLLDFTKTKDFRLLEGRIKFLTGNFAIRNSSTNSLKAGIFYNYQHINDIEILNELNLFYKKALYAKSNSFGRKLSAALTDDQKSILKKYSFKHGFTNKAFYRFEMVEMSRIKNCWDE